MNMNENKSGNQNINSGIDLELPYDASLNSNIENREINIERQTCEKVNMEKEYEKKNELSSKCQDLMIVVYKPIETIKASRYYTFIYDAYLFLYMFLYVYLFWILIHVASANAYVYFCAHPSFVGIITSAVNTQSPHCRALRYSIDTGVNIINSMWSTLGVWLSSKFLSKSKL